MLLIGDITFPRWNGDAQFDPYITEKHIDDALNRGQSLDAAERTAGANEFQIDNTDAKVTGKLLLKAVDKRRADVVRFMVERGADLNFPTYLLHAAVRRGRYSIDAGSVNYLFYLCLDLRVRSRPSARTRRRPSRFHSCPTGRRHPCDDGIAPTASTAPKLCPVP